jgi:hypothetical protein
MSFSLIFSIFFVSAATVADPVSSKGGSYEGGSYEGGSYEGDLNPPTKFSKVAQKNAV